MRNPVKRAVASYVRALQLAGLLSVACVAGAVQAQDKILLPTQQFNYGITYSTWDDPVDYGIAFDLGYGYSLSPRNWLEGKLSLAVLETGSDTLPDFYQSTLGADFLRSLGHEGAGHFFILGGGGVSMNDVSPDSEDGTSFYVNAGVGYRTAVSPFWGVRPRVELRYVRDSVLDAVDAIALSVKIEIPPNRQSVVERTVEVEKVVEVPVEVERIVEKDVTCVVPPVGSADTDGDGVADGADKCPGTLAGAKVDGQGCVVEEQKINLPNIEFESGKTVLARGGKEKLEAVVEFLVNQAEVQVDVFGHTDAQGKDSYNQTLSEGRAKAVMDYLVSRGIDAGRLSSKGFGETQPIATNETAEGRAQNRRVELLLRTKK